MAAAASSFSLTNRPSHIEWTSRRGRTFSFLIMDAPKTNNLQLYLKECKKFNVVHMARVCEKTYPAEEVEKAGIIMHELEYDDGSAPPADVIDKWLQIVNSTFRIKARHESALPSQSIGEKPMNPTIAIHCIAGLGRAPVLVAIALIENGMDPIEAVEFIRECRRGSINRKQLSYLQLYEKSSKKLCECCIC